MDIKVRRQPGVSDIFVRQIQGLWEETPAPVRSYVGLNGWRVRAELIDLEDEGIQTQAGVYCETKKQIVYYQYCQTPRGRCQNAINLLIHYHELGHVVREQSRMHAPKYIKAGRADELCRFHDYRMAFESDYRRLSAADISDFSYFLSHERNEHAPSHADPYKWAHARVIEESYCELFGEHAAQRGGELTDLLPAASRVVQDDIARILPCLAPDLPLRRFVSANAAMDQPCRLA